MPKLAYRLYNDDCLDVMRGMKPDKVDTIICDPPYGIRFMGKAWDGVGIEEAVQKRIRAEHDTGIRKDSGKRRKTSAFCCKSNQAGEYDQSVRGHLAFQVWCTEWATEALRVAKPGAMLLAFGGTRTHHRLMCAIEDAGWEIRDCVMWVYGSGFPKSHSIGKAIDRHGGNSVAWFGPWFRTWRETNGVTQKQVAALFPSKTGGLTGCVANWELGFNMPTCEQFNAIKEAFGLPFESLAEAEREVVAKRTMVQGGGTSLRIRQGERRNVNADITAPATPAAQLWEGYGTALKPAWEPVIVAMKPLASTFAANALEHGVAGLNVDGTRIRSTDNPTALRRSYGYTPNPEKAAESEARGALRDRSDPEKKSQPNPSDNLGRWPANLIWSHVPDADCPACSGDYPACRLCGGTGVIQGCVRRGVKRVKGITGTAAGKMKGKVDTTVYGLKTKSGEARWKGATDAGKATGYADADGLETVEDWDCHPDCPSRAFPSQKSPANYTRNAPNSTRLYGGAKQAGEEQPGYGDSGSAARFFKCCNYGEADRLFYCGKAPKREKWFYCRDCQAAFPESIREQHGHGHTDAKGKQTWDHVAAHPTVKPLSLMEYLCKLTMTPTGGIVLDPFMGSGSTGVACAMTGRQFIGIENDTEHGYFKVAQERIRKAYRENPL